MLSAILAMGILGLVVGVGLAVASKVFYVYVDPTVLAIDDVLPGANCGGCGYPGCSANAEAIVAGESPPNSCVAGGDDLTAAIAAILGVTVAATEPDFAKPGCYYSVEEAETKYQYLGIQDCRAAAMLSGGMKVCGVGCLGLGTCVKACPFDALSMGPDGLPVVDNEKCTGCGTCERVCPKHIIKLSSVTRRIMREYTVDDCTTPCQRACPAGIDIRGYINEIAQGNFGRAVQIIKERNPFPAVIGRICPHPCEFDCRRNLVDEGVAINYLKRFAADYEMKSGERVFPYKAPETGRTAAVVGGGIEGLSTAFFLARLGHTPTVFEASDKLGGLLRTAIPENRLSREVLDWEIQGILEMGVKAQTGTPMGGATTVAKLLKDGFEAVFLAPGGWDSRMERLAEADPEPVLPGMHLLVDYLKSGNKIPVGETPVFVGGGPSAVSAALSGPAGKPVVVLRTGQASVPADLLEKARNGGVTVLFDTAVTAICGKAEEMTEVAVAGLASGETKTLPATGLVLAAGRTPELIVRKKPVETEEGEAPAETPAADQGPVEWEALPPYKKPMAGGGSGLLAPSDSLADFSAAVEAIGAGRRAAASVHMILNGETPFLADDVILPTLYVQNVHEVEDVTPEPREIMPLKNAADENKDAPPEIELGYSQEMAVTEAKRCLQCGLVCYQHTAVPKDLEAA